MRASRLVPVPAFSDNYIWVADDGAQAMVVDPGEAAPVVGYLSANGLALGAIVITHHHGDHVGGIAGLLEAVAQGKIRAGARPVPVYGPAAENIAGLTQRLRQGDTVELTWLGEPLHVMEVPGHTSGHIAYYQPGDAQTPPRLFCGDTLFAAGCGRLFEGTPEQMFRSLGSFAELPQQTQVCCAHEYTLSNLRFALELEPGNADLLNWNRAAQALRDKGLPTLPTTIGQERLTNPFLRCTLPEVSPGLAASASRHAGRALSRPVEILAALREWKNTFR
ncbi:MAG: hydroxyacylglutathione hydrolase [Candidatus Protistobacter heckmanni]|nr:hydroxyacylglutathione hydrolase [Candidatus Protistobacter heckmanni]